MIGVTGWRLRVTLEIHSLPLDALAETGSGPPRPDDRNVLVLGHEWLYPFLMTNEELKEAYERLKWLQALFRGDPPPG
ncbi:MAG: hypothetical protein WA463_04755, partial [Terriglobales bacterium]